MARLISQARRRSPRYFLSGVTRSAEWRESQLIALRSMLRITPRFYAALWSDSRRNRIEADLVDVKCTTSEIDQSGISGVG
jgi:hypothetical protein